MKTYTRRDLRQLKSIVPTDRQIDYWRSQGLLGDHHKKLGSGNRDAWTAEEMRALMALRGLGDQLEQFGYNLSVELVAHAWPTLLAGRPYRLTFEVTP